MHHHGPPVSASRVEQGQLVSRPSMTLRHSSRSWQLGMLRSVYPHLDTLAIPGQANRLKQAVKTVLRGHLVWAFETAQRPSGHWARCYYTSGRPKDDVFQLDQQCYPLLELAEFADFSRDDVDQALVRRLVKYVDKILGVLSQHRWAGGEGDSRDVWLFKTDETPADDEVDYPYHFSSHILLWHSLDRLAALSKTMPGAIHTPVGAWAEAVHRDTIQQFTTLYPATGHTMFAYLTSTTGVYQFYHDANDLPTALAPLWGFCDPSDHAWRHTIAYAFSTHNKEGFYPGGKYGGLGSVHTRDPWPLGDAQQLLIALTTPSALPPGAQGAETVMDKLVAEVQWDGLFSEAVDRYTGEVTSKHWFCWPGSFVSMVLLDHFATTSR